MVRCFGVVLAMMCMATFVDTMGTAEAREVAKRRVSVQDLVTLQDIDGLRLSPDQKWIAFNVRQADPSTNSYDVRWVVLPASGRARPTRVANGGSPILAVSQGRVIGAVTAPTPAWSPDSNWIAFLRQDKGAVRVWRANRRGGREELLTHNEGDARTLVYSADGARILYEVAPRAASDASFGGFLYDHRFFPSYSVLPISREEQGARVWSYELASRVERLATASEMEEFRERTGKLARSEDGRLAWTEARDPHQQGVLAPVTVVARSPAIAEPIICRASECSGQAIEGLWWGSGNEVVFSRREGNLLQDTAIYVWRPNEDTVRLVFRTVNRLTSFGRADGECGVARERLICFYEGPDFPRRLVGIHLSTGELETLYEPNPDFHELIVGMQPRRIDIATASGVSAYGYLVLPPNRRGGERMPLVVVTYRCSGFLRGGTGDEYPVFPFAAEGFAVLCFNTPDIDHDRLARMNSSDYQAWARGPGDPEKRRVQEALDAVVEDLDAGGIIDPNRIGLTGLSFGAETVTLALFSMKHRPAAAIASGVGFEPSSTFLHGSTIRESMRGWGLGRSSSRWQSLSLSVNAERVVSPLLLNVADHELLAALEPVTALEEAGRPVEMYVFPNEYHVKWQPAHRLAIYNRNIDWMNFWLRGVERSLTGDPEQYTRWRAMRMKQCERLKGEDAPWYCRQHPDPSVPQRHQQ